MNEEKHNQKNASLSIEINRIRGDETLVVEISNNSEGKAGIWKYSNSWGWDNWRILVLRGNLTFLIRRNPNEGFTVNIPESVPIPPHKKRIEELNMNDGDWRCNNASGFKFQKGDEIIAVFSVAVTPESKSLHVWTGTALAYSRNGAKEK